MENLTKQVDRIRRHQKELDRLKGLLVSAERKPVAGPGAPATPEPAAPPLDDKTREAHVKAADDQYLATIQQELERTPSTGQVFAPEMVANLPEPARRYFLHAIQPGTPLAAQVHLKQTGTLRVGTDWIPFSAEQVLTPDGLVWRANSRLGPLPITATDHLATGQGRTRIAALSG